MSKKKKFINNSDEKGFKQTAHKILRYMLKYPNKQLNHKQLASGLQFRNARQKDHLIKVLSKLAAKEQLIEVSPGKFKINIENNTAVGVIDFTTSGAAYVNVDGFDQDVYIPKGQSKNALQNDLVQLMLHDTSGKKQEGSILEVIQRNRVQYVGILEIVNDGKFGFVNVDQTSLHVDIYVSQK